MQLKIDGHSVDAQCGESLLDLVKKLGLDSTDLRTRPLAANIAGETFTLNYVPVREQETKSAQRPTPFAVSLARTPSSGLIPSRSDA